MFGAEFILSEVEELRVAAFEAVRSNNFGMESIFKEMIQKMQINYRRMESEDLHFISQLDRSEHVTTAYEIRNGALSEIEVDWDVPSWFVDTEGDHSLSEQLEFCRSHLDQGGVMLGAFKDDLLVGMALVRPKLREHMAQLAFLHVSKGYRRQGIATTLMEYRRQGIATTLMEYACEIARDVGAVQMYISSIPSSSAIGFYLAQGCTLAEELDPELYALEPEDVHLVLDL
jgi:GNAT superfamily N-acetyltransferase